MVSERICSRRGWDGQSTGEAQSQPFLGDRTPYGAVEVLNFDPQPTVDLRPFFDSRREGYAMHCGRGDKIAVASLPAGAVGIGLAKIVRVGHVSVHHDAVLRPPRIGHRRIERRGNLADQLHVLGVVAIVVRHVHASLCVAEQHSNLCLVCQPRTADGG